MAAKYSSTLYQGEGNKYNLLFLGFGMGAWELGVMVDIDREAQSFSDNKLAGKMQPKGYYYGKVGKRREIESIGWRIEGWVLEFRCFEF